MVIVYDRAGSVFRIVRRLALAEPVLRSSDVTRTSDASHVRLFIAANLAEVPWDSVESDGMVISAEPSDDEALEALARGLVGYVDAGTGDSALRRAVRECLDGGTAFPRRVVSRWLRRQNICARAHCSVDRLSSRQREILALISEGLADKEIAYRLGISIATTQKHVTNILERLGVANRAAAVAAVCALVIGRESEPRLRAGLAPTI